MVDACGTTTYPYAPGDRDRDSQGSTPLRDFDRGAKFLLTGFNGFSLRSIRSHYCYDPYKRRSNDARDT
jgi:hypothetical protein